jgi:opacity protein-like surface antigen
MKRLLLTLAFGISCGCAAASDSNPLGFYIGGSVGQSEVRSSVSSSSIDYQLPKFDEHSTGWKAVVGMRPVSFFAAELAYINFGHPNQSTSYGGCGLPPGNTCFTFPSNVLQRAPTLSGLFYLPLPVPMLEVYAKAGVARLESSGTTYTLCSNGLCPQIIMPPTQFSRTDTDFLYGAGLQVKVSALAFRLEYERINDSQGDPDLLSAGVVWTF